MRFKNLPKIAAESICAIFCADFFTMLLMNILRLPTKQLPVLFFLSFFLVFYLLRRSKLIPEAHCTALTSKELAIGILFVLVIGVLFAGVRLPYLLETHLHHLVGPVVYDDTWHFQEINSLVNSVGYPAKCSLIPNQYFSFYYAPWMMIAAIYLALPVDGFTIKAAFAVGCAIYQILICLTLLHIGTGRAQKRSHLYWAIYMIGLWGGLESVFSLLYYLLHNSRWMLIMDMPIHFPAYGVGMVWAVHHMSSAVALVLCWYIWDETAKKNGGTIACCSFLIAYSLYASVFVFLGAVPLGITYLLLQCRSAWKPVFATAFLSAAIIWPLLWLYLGKTGDVRFLFPYISGTQELFPILGSHAALHLHHSFYLAGAGRLWLGFLVFLVFIGLNFLPYSIAMILYGSRLKRPTRVYAGVALLFIFSTYFIGFPEGDNYASRGYVVPILVLGWICAGILPTIRTYSWIAVGLLLGAFAFLHEGIQTYKRAIYVSRTPLTANYDRKILAINRDRKVTTIAADEFWNRPDIIYDVDKFVEGGKIDLVTADRQLECAGPHGPWRWQKNPAISRK